MKRLLRSDKLADLFLVIIAKTLAELLFRRQST